MTRLKWHIDGTAPLYIQLSDSLRHAIISGGCEPGARIASVRELAADARRCTGGWRLTGQLYGLSVAEV